MSKQLRRCENHNCTEEHLAVYDNVCNGCGAFTVIGDDPAPIRVCQNEGCAEWDKNTFLVECGNCGENTTVRGGLYNQQYLGRTVRPDKNPAPIARTTVLSNGLKIHPHGETVTVSQGDGEALTLSPSASPAEMVVFTRAVADIAVKAERARIIAWVKGDK